MFANAVKICTLNRFEIKVDPSWLLIAALITWSLSRQYFPNVLPGQTSNVYLIMAIAAMLSFFGSLLLHELAHSVIARSYGVQIKSITLFLFGGVAELETDPQTAAVEFQVALAGPVMSLTLAFGFWVFAGIAAMAPMPAPVIAVLSYLSLINLVLALFNLVPAFPLDGGRVLRAYLWHRNGDVLRATELAANSGAVFAYALMAFGLIALFQGATVTGLWYILIGGFVLLAAKGSYQAQLMRTAFDGKTVEALMIGDPVVVSPDMTLNDMVNKIMLKHRISFVPVVEDRVLLGHIDTAVLGGIDRENWAGTRVNDVFTALDGSTKVRSDLPIRDLMALIARTGRRKFLVTDNHALLGVITLADLTAYLHLSAVLSRPTKSH
ncbi:MAG: site-2 protease family protein [Roseovarius sp.]|nr:site-2 protease family protein [Roseovarius sp.]